MQQAPNGPRSKILKLSKTLFLHCSKTYEHAETGPEERAELAMASQRARERNSACSVLGLELGFRVQGFGFRGLGFSM